MDDLTEVTISDTVIKTLRNAPDPRTREIAISLVRHLHDFAREVRLTPQEWLDGIEFFTRVGQACTSLRQEAIVLSDTLGLSTLVNLMHNAQVKGATAPSLVGPFYREGVAELAHGSMIAANTSADPIYFRGRVLDAQGNALEGVTVEVWHTDTDGAYDTQKENTQIDLRGKFVTGATGEFAFRTVTPLGYSIPTDGPVFAMLQELGRHTFRPAHMHFLITLPGYRDLTTALFIEPDPYIESDTVFGVSSSLVTKLLPPSGHGEFPTLRQIVYDFKFPLVSDTRSVRLGADPAKVANVKG